MINSRWWLRVVSVRLLLLFLFFSGVDISAQVPGNGSVRSESSDEVSVRLARLKARRFLDKEQALGDFYSIDSSGISLFASAEKKSAGEPEFKVYWNEINYLRQLIRDSSEASYLKFLIEKKSDRISADRLKKINASGQPANKSRPAQSGSVQDDSLLKGIRIALDPGHVADDIGMAKLEKKYIEMNLKLANGDSKKIELIESRLTYETAMLLKSKLERQGATVLLSRPEHSDFENWLSTSFSRVTDSLFSTNDLSEKERTFLLTRATKRAIFKDVYVGLETQQRARKINAFQPDYTLIIHYNVDETNTGWTRPSSRDYDMVFVGGSFMKNELEKQQSRAEFLRMLITDDIDNSILFSSYVIKSFEQVLKVPTAQQSDAKYLKDFCLPAGENGVFCRNLMLTRLVHGTLVYGETLYQDNQTELELLSGPDIPDRVGEVANAYYEAIIKSIKKAVH